MTALLSEVSDEAPTGVSAALPDGDCPRGHSLSFDTQTSSAWVGCFLLLLQGVAERASLVVVLFASPVSMKRGWPVNFLLSSFLMADTTWPATGPASAPAAEAEATAESDATDEAEATDAAGASSPHAGGGGGSTPTTGGRPAGGLGDVAGKGGSHADPAESAFLGAGTLFDLVLDPRCLRIFMASLFGMPHQSSHSG